GIGYTPYSAAPSQPVGDTVTINAQPGTGATQAETWTHESQLGSALQTSLEFEAQQRQKAEENARAEAQLAMSKAEASRQAALGGPPLQAAQLANQQTQQAMALAKAANDRAELDAFIKSGGFSLADWNRIKTGMAQTQSYLGGRPTTPELASAQQQVYSRQYAPAPGGGTAYMGDIVYDRGTPYLSSGQQLTQLGASPQQWAQNSRDAQPNIRYAQTHGMPYTADTWGNVRIG